MTPTPFLFKQFSIHQDKTAMKIGTDGILLGAWANCEAAANILDIGCGTGVLCLMMAQKNSTAQIVGVEIDENASLQAKQNIDNSRWKNRISIENQSIQSFTESTNMLFDFIISNPPFFVNSSKNPDKSRTLARHNDELPFSALAECVFRLLLPNGRFAVILPTEEFGDFSVIAAQHGLFCTRQTLVRPVETKPIHRILGEFSKTSNQTIIDELVIETNRRHYYTEKYKELTRPFYLHFKDEKSQPNTTIY
jgi:tRNA1Val (adenine37-N6)-methyltransferase